MGLLRDKKIKTEATLQPGANFHKALCLGWGESCCISPLLLERGLSLCVDSCHHSAVSSGKARIQDRISEKETNKLDLFVSNLP